MAPPRRTIPPPGQGRGHPTNGHASRTTGHPALSVCVGPGVPQGSGVVVSVVEAAEAEVEALPEGLRSSTLAATVLDLARRLDSEPSDRDATGLARELRLALGELHRLAGGTGTEQEAIVARISNASLGY